MRNSSSISFAITSIAVAVAAHASGCFGDPAKACQESFECATGSRGGGTTTNSGGAGGTITPEGCVPSDTMDPVENECGTFVSPMGNDDSNDGTKEKPYATLGKAIVAAGDDKKIVYACAQQFTEAVEVPGGIQIYGGLDCATDWKYVEGQKTTIASGAGLVPLRLLAGSGIRLEDVALVAADAVEPGGSSIAAIADGATVDFERCDFTAGRGMPGSNGDPSPPAMPKAEGGNLGGNACSDPTQVNGGLSKANPDCMDAVGGSGGIGVSAGNGGGGSPGSPDGAANGGAGEGVAACMPGQPGTAGMPGEPGAAGTEPGALTSEGFAGANGGNGAPGTVAHGGGGGGGAKGGIICTAALMPGAGASGGSGGPGGCGGLGGQGGKAGGASIALVTLDATVTLTDVTLTAVAGGKGGDGAAGQSGQAGGDGANGGMASGFGTSKAGCRGGDGAEGGNGGQGGGGRGGHSISTAHRGAAPTPDRVTYMRAAAGAPGGAGGNPGAIGEATDVVSFP